MKTNTKYCELSERLTGPIFTREKLAHVSEVDASNPDLQTIRLKGEAGLKRLLPVAQRDTGQSSVIARFLSNLYNGERFPFDMTDLRRLDHNLFDDCIAVLEMDFLREREIHHNFKNGGAILETLAKEWGFRDYAGAKWR